LKKWSPFLFRGGGLGVVESYTTPLLLRLAVQAQVSPPLL